MIQAVYTPESRLRRPGQLFREMWNDLLASRELAWRLAVRDVTAKYRQSIFGLLWAFLPPIATTGVFVLLNRSAVLNTGDIAIPYPAYVMLGTILWQLFTESLNAPLRVVNANKVMLAKVDFPREALILSAIAQVLFDFCIKLIVLVGVFAAFGIVPSSGALLAPVPALVLLLLGFALGTLLVPLGVLYSDVTSALPVLTGLWFFLTPVAYAPPSGGKLQLLIKANPVTSLLVCARELVVTGTAPVTFDLLLVSSLTAVGLLAIWVLFRLALPIVIERLGD